MHSTLAASHDTERANDLKLAIHRFRISASLLTYIVEHLPPLPSCDLSQDVLKFLSGLMLAQAVELCYTKCIADHKGGKLAARVAAQTALMNSGLTGEIEMLAERNMFDRNWSRILKVNRLQLPA